jgi:hypothetical protein
MKLDFPDFKGDNWEKFPILKTLKNYFHRGENNSSP